LEEFLEYTLIITKNFWFTIVFFSKYCEVFSVGYNNHGQLGIGNTTKNLKLQKIEFFKNKNIVDINTGLDHSLAISKKR